METQSQLLGWLLNNRYRIPFHLLFWIVVYLDEVLSFLGITDAITTPSDIVLPFILDVTIVYLNLYYLIPRFLLRNNILAYGFLTVLSLSVDVALPLIGGDYSCVGCTSFTTHFIVGFLVSSQMLGSAAGIKFFKKLIEKQQQLKEMETTSLRTELEYLKQQINPHFLFNALNSIYVQSRVRPQEAGQSTLLLSDLLRYQLYDCTKEKVPLKGEIEYLRNYLALDKIRKSNVDLIFNIVGTPSDQMVAPFIFLPFIENAIKHGLSLDSESFIRIQFQIEADSIDFSIENSKPALPASSFQRDGIGLNNVKRRLALLYPQKHTLRIDDLTDSYRVTLHLNLLT